MWIRCRLAYGQGDERAQQKTKAWDGLLASTVPGSYVQRWLVPRERFVQGVEDVVNKIFSVLEADGETHVAVLVERGRVVF